MKKLTHPISLIAIAVVVILSVFFIVPSAKENPAGDGQGSFSPFKLVTTGSTSYAQLKTSGWVLSIGQASVSAGFELTGYASASGAFTLNSAATRSFDLNSASTTQGACIALKDADGSGISYCRAKNGTLTCNTTSCK